jgi:hypothetical protein
VIIATNRVINTVITSTIINSDQHRLNNIVINKYRVFSPSRAKWNFHFFKGVVGCGGVCVAEGGGVCTVQYRWAKQEGTRSCDLRYNPKVLNLHHSQHSHHQQNMNRSGPLTALTIVQPPFRKRNWTL